MADKETDDELIEAALEQAEEMNQVKVTIANAAMANLKHIFIVGTTEEGGLYVGGSGSQEDALTDLGHALVAIGNGKL